ncbi:hypothetical protein LINPERPRIM_LOCUS39753 [Linum perenne]
MVNYKPETHFVASSDGTTIQIYKLTTDPTTHPSSIRKEHWKNVATINTTAKDHQDVSLYDGLQFEDNHGRIEGRESLTMLAQHLAQLGFLVSDNEVFRPQHQINLRVLRVVFPRVYSSYLT